MSYIVNIIRKAGTLIGRRRTINFIEGSNVTLTVADDAVNDRVNVTIASAGGSGSPGGADTNIQYNDGGSFGGEAAFTYNKTTNTMTVDNVHTGTIQAHTSAGVVIEATGGADCALFGAGGGQNVTFYDGVKMDASTASRILSTDASKNITALDTATYPDLTELSYIKGVTSAIQTQLNGKQATLTNPVTGTGTNNEIAAFNSTGSTITSLSTSTYPSLTELAYVKGVTSAIQTQLDGKEPTITNGYGITGTTTKAVSVSYASAFATATTTISAATYADITGCSVSLAAGTWIIFAHVVGAQPNAIIQMFCAITHSDNTVIAESAQSRPASGAASLNSPMSCSFTAIVSPASTTTYKLRAARGLTTHTGSWVVYDGNGYNTTNHATNNSDKGTSIIAMRLA